MVEKLRNRNINVVVHIINGLPYETKEDMLKTIDYVAHSGANGIKFHLLHLMKNTKMVEQYENGELKLLSQEDYIGSTEFQEKTVNISFFALPGCDFVVN